MSNYSDTWKNIISNPTSFFEKMPKSGGYGEPLKFAIINYIIGGIELFVLLTFMVNVVAGGGLGLAYGIIFPIAGAIGLFINAVIYLVLFKIVGGKGSYEGTFRLVAYSSAPVALILIPILPLYSLYLLIAGGKYVHDISKTRAAIAVLLPIIVVGAAIIIPATIAAFVFGMGTPEQTPIVNIRVSSATPTSIELLHQGGESLELSDVQFTVKKANGELLKPSVASKSGSNTVYAGDTIRLYGANFGKSGDIINIKVTYKNGWTITSADSLIK